MTTTARSLVSNEPYRRRLLALERWHREHRTGHTLDELCVELASACEFFSHRRGSGRFTRGQAIRGVKVLIGLEADRWDATRQTMRQYRAPQLDQALTLLEKQTRGETMIGRAA